MTRALRCVRVLGTVAIATSTWGAIATAQSVAPGTAGAANAPSAVVSTVPANDVEILRQRAAAFWAARVAGDAGKQWELLEPRGRGRMTPDEYRAKDPGKYLAYQVEDAKVDGYFAKVKVRVIIMPVRPPALAGPPVPVVPVANVVDDVWVRINGTWFHSLEPDGGFGQRGSAG
jgi:hypothetical protein